MSLAYLGYTGRARCAAALREVDLTPDNLAGIHLSIACAWLISFGIGRAPEGILFGALVGVSLIRLPRTLPFLVESLKSSKAVLICMALLVFIALSAAWSPSEAKADWYPPRHMLYPILLAPLLARWRLLVFAYMAGIAFQASWILIEYALVKDYHYGYPLGSSRNVHFWGGHMATAAILAACMSLDGTCRRPARILSTVAFVLYLSSALTIAGRTTAVALAAGLASAGLWAIARTHLGWRLPTLLLACIVTCGIAFGSTLATRLQQGVQDQSAVTTQTRIHNITSGRTWMWQVTLSAWNERPMIGWGRDAWASVFHTRVTELPAETLWRSRDALRHLNTAHSTYVQAAIDQGALGLLLVSASLASLAAAAWRSRVIPAMPLLGLTAYWAVSGITLSELNTSHGLVPFGMMMTLALGAAILDDQGRTVAAT